MEIKTLAHVSDLHIGKNVDTERRALGIRDALLASEVDHVVVTGDLTHRGRLSELQTFWRIFAPLAEMNRLTIVPGNHDRLGDDVADAIQDGPSVSITEAPGLHLVRFDSTGPHNRAWLAGHGLMLDQDVRDLEHAASAARPGAVVAILLHHHVLPLPADHTAERVCTWLGWPYANELEKGADLLALLRGRCDLVLHGHRHTPQSITLFENEPRPLSVFNAGSSTELGRVRVFFHNAGRLRPGFGWLPTGESPEAGYEAIVSMREGRRPGSSRAA